MAAHSSYRYTHQLMFGCEAKVCHTPTCFTCRKSLAGKAGLRRYTPTSARALAIYLASQENPEKALCRNPPAPHSPEDIYKPTRSRSSTKKHDGKTQGIPPATSSKNHTSRGANGQSHGSEEKLRGNQDKKDKRRSRNIRINVTRQESASESESDLDARSAGSGLYKEKDPRLNLLREPSKTDHKSFVQNVCNTVAFRMLDWLTPQSLESMTTPTAGARQQNLATKDPKNGKEVEDSSAKSEDMSSEGEQGRFESTPCSDSSALPPTSPNRVHPSDPCHAASTVIRNRETEHGIGSASLQPGRKGLGGLSNVHGVGKYSRHSLGPKGLAGDVTTIRSDTPMSPQMEPRRTSFHSQELSLPEDQLPETIRSDKRATAPLKHVMVEANVSVPNLSPPLSSVPSLASSLTTSTQSLQDQSLHERTSRNSATAEVMSTTDSISKDDWSNRGENKSVTATLTSRLGSSSLEDTLSSRNVIEDGRKEEILLPQSLKVLPLDFIEYLCNMMQNHGCVTEHSLHPRIVPAQLRRSPTVSTSDRRFGSLPICNGTKVKLASVGSWKEYVEQSFFYVLSQPDRLLDSFVDGGSLVDSPSLWYAMFRLTRVFPAIVFDSLWLSAITLYGPPPNLREHVPGMKRWADGAVSGPGFNPTATAQLLSIFFHVLAASLPFIDDLGLVYNISRFRSQGLIIPVGGHLAPVPVESCAQYNDILSNDLALRLALRVFGSIPTVRHYQELMEMYTKYPQPDILHTILASLRSAVPETSGPPPYRAYKDERHKRRMGQAILDWARAVMAHDWNRKATVSVIGPFAGALAVMAEFCMYPGTSFGV
jgi:hypothetical protein